MLHLPHALLENMQFLNMVAVNIIGSPAISKPIGWSSNYDMVKCHSYKNKNDILFLRIFTISNFFDYA